MKISFLPFNNYYHQFSSMRDALISLKHDSNIRDSKLHFLGQYVKMLKETSVLCHLSCSCTTPFCFFSFFSCFYISLAAASSIGCSDPWPGVSYGPYGLTKIITRGYDSDIVQFVSPGSLNCTWFFDSWHCFLPEFKSRINFRLAPLHNYSSTQHFHVLAYSHGRVFKPCSNLFLKVTSS